MISIVLISYSCSLMKHFVLLSFVSLQKLERRLGTHLGLELLEEINLPIEYKEFDPENSSVSVQLQVTTPKDWHPPSPDQNWDCIANLLKQVHIYYLLSMRYL